MNIWNFNFNNQRIKTGKIAECETYLYISIAHELLHYFYNLEYDSDDFDHWRMYKEGHMNSVMRLITNRFGSGGEPYADQNRYLRKQAELQNKELDRRIFALYKSSR